MKQHSLIETPNGFPLDDRGDNIFFNFFLKCIFSWSELFLQIRGRILKKDGLFSFLIKRRKKKKRDFFDCLEHCSEHLALKLDFIQIVPALRPLLRSPFSARFHPQTCRLWWCQGSTCFCRGGLMRSLLKCHHELQEGTDWEWAPVPGTALGSEQLGVW